MTVSPSAAYFVSDAHLGISLPPHDNRETDLIGFLRRLEGNATHLFILGDLFDFWIEYRHAVRPEYFEALYALRRLSDAGTRIHYLMGNHDFALGPFLVDHVGLRIHEHYRCETLQGRKVYLFHGDGLIRADYGYRILKRILRNKRNQQLYRLLHPTLAIGLASFFSGSSRALLARRCGPEVLREYRRHARELLRRDNDIVVFGHTHAPEITEWDDGTYCNCGEWIRQYTYAVMREGRISLWRYHPEGDDERIGPSAKS